MSDHYIERDGVRLHARVDGVDHAIAPTVVFANSLGTTLHLWDKVLPLLPEGLRYIRYDKRGHGLSDVPAAPYTMGALVSDAEAICDHFNVRDGVFVGLSVGGMIAQGLAVKRLDIMRALVLCDTAARIGTPKLWDDRIAAIRANGLESIADSIMERWFGREFRATPDMAPWRQMMIDTPVEGYIGCCQAISGTDFFSTTATLRLPTLGIVGAEDRSTPPDLVRETVDLIPGARFEIIRKAGHLPCVENPIAFAEVLTEFLTGVGHV